MTTASTGYDAATKLWTILLGIALMVTIQWPSVLINHSKHPPLAGNFGWTVVAAVCGGLPPFCWFVSEVARRHTGWQYLVILVGVIGWGTVAIGWAQA